MSLSAMTSLRKDIRDSEYSKYNKKSTRTALLMNPELVRSQLDWLAWLVRINIDFIHAVLPATHAPTEFTFNGVR